MSIAALAALTLAVFAAALPSPASAQLSAAAKHKAALAAKAKAAAAAKAKAAGSSAITPLPSTGAGAGGSADPGNAPAPGGTTLDPVLLYSGAPLSAGTVQASPWGGGTVADHDGDAYTAAGHTIQVDTAGLYQGAQIAFGTPVALGDLKSQTTRYLQIIFSAAPSQQYAALPMSPLRPMDAHFQSFPGSYQIAQAPYGGYSGRRRPGAGASGVPYGANPYGQSGAGARTPSTVPDELADLPTLAIGSLHVIYEFANGSRSETLRPMSVTLGEDINWLRASIPLSAIPAPPVGSAQLAKLYIGTDVPATLNIGEIRLITDTAPITADAGTNKTVPLNTQVTLVGTGEGGASSLKYEWNFDSPSAQPFVPEAEGVTASYTFGTPGDHIVTLRVSDLDGIKPPATAVVTIHVDDQSAAPSQGGYGAPTQGGYGRPSAQASQGYPNGR